MRNQTGIENWILRKAQDRNHRRRKEFIYPYDLGAKENFRQVFNWRESFNVIGDGIVWPVREGTDEYDLTREQLEQKKEKRQRTIRYSVVQSYPGSFITLRYGFRTCICIPCSDETRMPIEKDDYVLVTRWERYWLYGERVISDETNKSNDKQARRRRRPRGWFPRCCVYEAFRMEDLWSGKIDPDCDIVREQLSNIAPDDDEYNEAQPAENNEVNQSDSTVSTTTGSASPSKTVKKRKSRKDN